MIKQRFKDQYLQIWNNEINTNSICLNYRMFKRVFGFENYLLTLERPLRDYMMKFRFSNHKLPIHSQRFAGIQRSERVCELCNSEEIGDEFHYLFNCQDATIARERKKLLNAYFLKGANAIKYHSLMNVKSYAKQRKLARLVGLILGIFRR